MSDVNQKANASGQFLREGMNEVLQRLRVPWAAYGEFSGIHLFTNPDNRAIDASSFDPFETPWQELKRNSSDAVTKLRLAMLINGVEFNGFPGGTISSAHSKSDLEFTIDAFEESLHMLRAEQQI